MNRKEKREFARNIAKLEMRLQKTTDKEERASIEATISDMITNSFSSFTAEDVTYIDEFIQERLR